MKRHLFSFFYNCVLFFLIVLFLPKLLWQIVVQGKYRKSFFSRLRGEGPTARRGAPVIWLHAVSMGEIKALSTLLPHIRLSYPEAFILISTVTETGKAEAERLAPSADTICYLPLDFSWTMRRFVRRLRPNLLILVEGDFWYHALREVKSGGGAVVLVNGKVSETSSKRYPFCRAFSHALFQKIDYFCVQEETYLNRFLKLGIDPDRMTVIGNLKYDIPSLNLSDEDRAVWKGNFGITSGDVVVTVGSTHEREEQLLLNVLKPLWDKYKRLKLLLVPRHPERFRKVEKYIQMSGIYYSSYSTLSDHAGDERIILVDKMGILPYCYWISNLSIVGGSFVDGIGGHDVFEPAKMGVPVLFGPYMHNQVELAHALIQSGVGKQVSIDALLPLLERYLSTPTSMAEDGEKGKQLAEKVMGSAQQTWQQIKGYIAQTSS